MVGGLNPAAFWTAEFWVWEPAAVGVRSSIGSEGGISSSSSELPREWKSVLLLGFGRGKLFILANSKVSEYACVQRTAGRALAAFLASGRQGGLLEA